MLANIILQSGSTRAAWAERLGISASYLSDILNGKKRPSLELAVRIESATAGAVTPASWVPDAEGAAPAEAWVPDAEGAA